METDDRPIAGKNPDGINGQYRKRQAAWERFSTAPSGAVSLRPTPPRRSACTRPHQRTAGAGGQRKPCGDGKSRGPLPPLTSRHQMTARGVYLRKQIREAEQGARSDRAWGRAPIKNIWTGGGKHGSGRYSAESFDTTIYCRLASPMAVPAT